MSVSAQIARNPRVGFKHPVRVVPMSKQGTKAYRLLSSNLSKDGMFLAMPGVTPLAPGTRLILSLEAGGRVLPFAEAEVVWRRQQQNHTRAKLGFGVRFTGFLHPRAGDLVTHLLEDGQRQHAHSTAQRRWLWGSALASALVTVVGLAFWASTPAMAAFNVSAAQRGNQMSPSPGVIGSGAAVHSNAVPLSPAGVDSNLGAAASAGLNDDGPTPSSAGALPAPTDLEATTELDGAFDFDLDLPVRAAMMRALRVGLQERVALPSSAAGSLIIDRSPDGLRVAVEPAAQGRVTRVFAIDGPARLVFDVEGLSPRASQAVSVPGPELKRVRVGQLGRGTRVVVDLARRPRHTAIDGQAIVLSY